MNPGELFAAVGDEAVHLSPDGTTSTWLGKDVTEEMALMAKLGRSAHPDPSPSNNRTNPWRDCG